MKRHILLTLATAIALAIALPSIAAAQEGDGEEEPAVDAFTLLEDANRLATKRNYKQAVPLYLKVLQLEPDRYPVVYYNLAEIKRFQSDCTAAVLLYERYLQVDPDTRDKAAVNRAIKDCRDQAGDQVKLAVTVKSKELPTIALNGIPVARAKSFTTEVTPGKYELLVTAADHDPHKAVVEVGAEGQDVAVELKEMTFFGDLVLTVNIEGAEVFIDGKKIGQTPVEKQKVMAGKRFVELKKPGYFNWIRNVVVPRNEELPVNITMEKRE